MTTDEAREAAWRDWMRDVPNDLSANAACRSAFDAGVVEGRRQAREAVEAVPVTQSRNMALENIDALTT